MYISLFSVSIVLSNEVIQSAQNVVNGLQLLEVLGPAVHPGLREKVITALHSIT